MARLDDSGLVDHRSLRELEETGVGGAKAPLDAKAQLANSKRAGLLSAREDKRLADLPAEDGEPANPEEQAQYKALVDNAAELIYGKEALPAIAKGLEGGGNPVAGLGNTLSMLMQRLMESSVEQDFSFSEGVMSQAVEEQILPMLLELSEASGNKPLSEKEQAAAMALAADNVRTYLDRSGRLNVDKAKADFETLMQADQQGRLDELLPGISEYAQAAGE